MRVRDIKAWLRRNKQRDPPKKAFREYRWEPKIYILKREMPGLLPGVSFQQAYQSDNIYFHGIPINSERPECDQVGIIEFEAEYVENNPKWFEKEK